MKMCFLSVYRCFGRYKANVLSGFACLLLILSFSACSSDKTISGDLQFVNFFVEMSSTIPPPHSETVILPAELGGPLSVDPEPAIREYEVANIELVHAEAIDATTGLARKVYLVQFQFTPNAASKLHRITSGNLGRRILVKLNGAPFSSDVITSPVSNGVWWTPTGTGRAESEELVIGLRETLAKLREKLGKHTSKL